jgi:hypothetical protein
MLEPELAPGPWGGGLEGLGKLKKSNDLLGIRTSDLPACSILPQPPTLPRATDNDEIFEKIKWSLAQNVPTRLNHCYKLMS